jgi:hypothetical protein
MIKLSGQWSTLSVKAVRQCGPVISTKSVMVNYRVVSELMTTLWLHHLSPLIKTQKNRTHGQAYTSAMQVYGVIFKV